MTKPAPTLRGRGMQRYQPYKKPDARPEIIEEDQACGTTPSEAFERLKNALDTKKNIVIISGAGISTNAGGESKRLFHKQGAPNRIRSVNDFRSSSQAKMSSRKIFDFSAYSMLDSATQLHSQMSEMFQSASAPGSTRFEELMEDLARHGRIHRHYTQNIDCRTERYPYLSQSTICLHGRLDTMMCHLYSQHMERVTPQTFQQRATAPCPRCEAENEQRVAMGRRSRTVGFLRPKVLLYGEYCPDDSDITDAFKDDLLQPVDAVIIVGTRLLIPPLKRFVERLCRGVKSSNRETMTLWVNKEEPRLGQKFESLIDHQFLGDCDSFASLL
jgi:NAD-dependent SIR2 family protein deacetylase